jgi:hypothetical protein
VAHLFLVNLDVLVLKLGLDLVHQEISVLLVDCGIHSAEHLDDVSQIVNHVVLNKGVLLRKGDVRSFLKQVLLVFLLTC